MRSNSMKFIGGFLLMIIAFLGVIYFPEISKEAVMAQQEEKLESSKINDHIDSSAIKNIDASMMDDSSAVTEGLPAKIQWTKVLRDRSLEAEENQWFVSRGYFHHEMGLDGFGNKVADAYDAYDDETLKRLGDTGDLRALDKLIRRAKSFNETIDFIEKAIVYGSTRAVANLGMYMEPSDLGDRPKEEQKNILMEVLSIYSAGELRGDWLASIEYRDELLRRFPMEFNAEEMQLIKNRGKEIYDYYEAKRVAMGLGSFDNSLPAGVQIIP